jgi:DNA transposition AAA+ family ATPase
MIKETEKQRIVEKLKGHVAKYDSQNKASNALKGISSATVSQMLNNNWVLISDEMWRKANAQIECSNEGWTLVETRDYKILTALLGDSQQTSQAYAVTGEAGSGKTNALRQYSNNNKRAYFLRCNEYWNRKYFLAELLIAMGRDASGLTVAEMMQKVVKTLQRQENPIIMMDEADKLSDQVLYFFITIYNELEDKCGLILCATDHLAKRIEKGLKLNKKGYKEIYSRIGRHFIELKGVGFTDVHQICVANGVTDKSAIKSIYKDSEDDLRRVKRKIHAFKMQQTI